MDFGTLLTRTAAHQHDKTALVSGDVRLSYAALDRRVNRLANAMLKYGVRPRQKVAISCHNTAEYIEAVFACVKINAISVHINWRMSAEEISRILGSGDIALLFFSARFARTYIELAKESEIVMPVVSVDGELRGAYAYDAFIQNVPDQAPPVPLPHDDDIAMEFFTSGTTAYPKGVLLSHRSMVCHAMTNLWEGEWARDDRYLFSTPLFHAAAAGAYACLISGCTLVLANGVQFPAFPELIAREHITRLALVPVILKQILEYPRLNDYDLTSLRIICYSGAPMPPELIERALKTLGCKFLQNYGMTEMGPVICVLGTEDHAAGQDEARKKRLFSAGKAVLSVYLRIVSEDGRECAPGEHGEVAVRGYGMMSGYDGMPEETASAIRDGWYHTGDVGYIDDAGYVYLVDRKTDIIVSGGENISAKEVEHCVLQMENDVHLAAVIGVPDPVWGESVKAFVVRKPGSRITAEEIIDHCKVHIAGYKKPRSVEFVADLPMNAGGKIMKNVLRLEYRKNVT